MSTETAPVDALAGVALHKLTVGRVGVPGAPILHLSLQVGMNHVSGIGSITQAISPPNGYIVISNITGAAYWTGLGPTQILVTLSGTYAQPFGPPPLIGEIEQKFSATLTLNNNWSGTGNFSYGGNHVKNVPVVPTP